MIKLTKKILAVLLTCCFCFSLVACSTRKEIHSVRAESLGYGDLPPDFYAKLSTGGDFVLSEQKGKVVVLNFWATWCNPCVGEMPAFQELYMIYGDKISILAINMGESKDTVDDFRIANSYIFPIAYDVDESICNLYPIEGIPYTVIIDQNGIVRETFTGARDADAQYRLYAETIDRILASGSEG